MSGCVWIYYTKVICDCLQNEEVDKLSSKERITKQCQIFLEFTFKKINLSNDSQAFCFCFPLYEKEVENKAGK